MSARRRESSAETAARRATDELVAAFVDATAINATEAFVPGPIRQLPMTAALDGPRDQSLLQVFPARRQPRQQLERVIGQDGAAFFAVQLCACLDLMAAANG